MNAACQQVFWKVCLDDFPDQREALAALLPMAVKAIDGKVRPFYRACADFLDATKAPWPRYDRWLNYRQRQDPRKPEFDGNELIASSSYREAGEFLAQRIIHAFYMAERRQRFAQNAGDRPYWKLVSGDGCPGCEDDPRIPLHWQSEYWKSKQLPCEWLGCKSRITALTEQ